MTSKQPSNLPQLLREAERRVNEHVWGDRRAIVSIPADVSRDVDILLLTAADQIEAMAAVGIRQERQIERLQGELDAANQHVKILSEARERLAHETSDVLKTIYKLAGGHATECQCRQCEIFELLEPIVGNSSRSAVEPKCTQAMLDEAHRLATAEQPIFDSIPIGMPRELSPSEAASFDKTLARSPRRVKEPARELTLLDFGYAPGNYTFKCHDCGQEAVGDKRALRCETCAAQALRENRRGAENGT